MVFTLNATMCLAILHGAMHRCMCSVLSTSAQEGTSGTAILNISVFLPLFAVCMQDGLDTVPLSWRNATRGLSGAESLLGDLLDRADAARTALEKGRGL